MRIHQETLQIHTRGKGTYEFTGDLESILAKTGMREGLLTAFCCHTSCSLVIMENADPSARRDLEAWLNRLVPEKDSLFTHTFEGPDDMPSHIKMALTRTSENIPFSEGQLSTGTWQGIFLWEHRDADHTRLIKLTFLGE